MAPLLEPNMYIPQKYYMEIWHSCNSLITNHITWAPFTLFNLSEEESAALIVCILAIVDPRNNPVPRGLEPLTVGLVVLVIGLSMGFNSGYAVNPARDLGPRIFTALAGANTYWFFVPLCAPFLGAAVGVLIYQLLIGYHLEGEVQKKQEEERSKRSNMTTNEEA
ncbi:Aquaporin-3 [Dissostichus eleginoides]|nr:Aquaporin-3 [Dissostichus eleginoides]